MKPLLACCLLLLFAPLAAAELHVVSSELIFEPDTAGFPECHASTIEQTPTGLVTAWFGGTEERDPDVEIWVSRHVEGAWTKPVSVADGVQPDGDREPTWNPVLWQAPDGPLYLFYKVGPSPRAWWGELKTSNDGGRTWSDALRLPDGILGPIKNKGLLLPDGRLLCGSSTEHDGWKVHMEFFNPADGSWTKTAPLAGEHADAVIQPALLDHGDGVIQIHCRSRGVGKIVESWSHDGGETWSPLTETDLPHPGSGIDATRLTDGRFLLIYNHTPRGRSPLNAAVSTGGRTWEMIATLEDQPGEYSYPAVIAAPHGGAHVVYTWNRKSIKYVRMGE